MEVQDRNDLHYVLMLAKLSKCDQPLLGLSETSFRSIGVRILIVTFPHSHNIRRLSRRLTLSNHSGKRRILLSKTFMILSEN